jgi:hypothetical protein
MTIEEMEKIDIAAVTEGNAHLYLWTTNSFMVEAHGVARARSGSGSRSPAGHEAGPADAGYNPRATPIQVAIAACKSLASAYFSRCAR